MGEEPTQEELEALVKVIFSFHTIFGDFCQKSSKKLCCLKQVKYKSVEN